MADFVHNKLKKSWEYMRKFDRINTIITFWDKWKEDFLIVKAIEETEISENG